MPKAKSILYFLFSQKFRLSGVFLCGMLLACFSLFGQQYGSAEKYLVDSLDLQAISPRDAALVDSMLTTYHECSNDTCRVNAISVIVEESWDDAVWPKYNLWVRDFVSRCLQKEVDKATQKHLQRALAGALNNQGYLLNSQGKPEEALNFYHQGLEIQVELDDKKGLAGSYINIGYIYHNQGLIDQGLEYYYKSLKIEEERGDEVGIARALNGIGYIHYRQGDNEKAFESYKRSLKIREKLKDSYGIATSLNNLGLLFKDQKEWDLALDYYQRGLEIEQKLADNAGIGISLSNIGQVYAQQGQHEKALDYFSQSLAIKEKLDDKDGTSHLLDQIAQTKLNMGQVREARLQAEKSLRLAKELNYPINIRNAAKTLKEIARRENNWQDAFRYQELYALMRDSINNEETRTSAIKRQYQYKYAKEALADSIRNADAQKVNEALLAASEAEKEGIKEAAARQQQRTYFLFGGLILALAFVAFIYSRLQLINRQKLLIEKQKEALEKEQRQNEIYIKSIEAEKEKSDLLIRELNQFAYIVSHDLKTPMRGIAGLISMIEADHKEIDEDLQNILALIKERSLKMHELVDGILAYTHAGQNKMNLEDVQVAPLIEAILKDFRNENDVQIQVNGVFPPLIGNKIQLAQIFANLIGNAIKYNDQEKGKGSVSISYESKEEFHEIKIADNGPGIPRNLQEKVFDLFNKGQFYNREDSSGIGLAIVKKLIQQNGGQIGIDPNVTVGTTFSFTWPKSTSRLNGHRA